jgi:hypothetical protein
MKNDIALGAQTMDSISPFAHLQQGGSGELRTRWWKWPSKDNTHCEGCGAGIYDLCKCADDEKPKKENQGYPPNYLDNNPKTVFGTKKLPLELVPPSAIAALAEAFADGAKKYGPYNWREKTISSSVYYGAEQRHMTDWWDGEDIAEDSGIGHLKHAMACIAMLIDAASVGKLNDNRPPKGAMPKLQKEWLEKHG